MLGYRGEEEGLSVDQRLDEGSGDAGVTSPPDTVQPDDGEPGDDVSEALPPRRVWPSLVVLPVVLVAIILSTGALSGVFAAVHVAEGVDDLIELMMALQDDWRFVSLVVVNNMVVMGALALIAARLSRERITERLGLVRPIISPPTLLLVIVGTGFLWATMMLTQHTLIDWSMEEFADEIQPLSNIADVHPLLLVLLLGVLPPVAEELLFRGYVQRRLTRRWGPVVGIAVASLAFAFFHGHPLQMAAVLPLGVWCGFIAWRSESVLPAMLAHAANNMLAVTFLLFLPMLADLQQHPEWSNMSRLAAPIVMLFMLMMGLCFVWAVIRLMGTDVGRR